MYSIGNRNFGNLVVEQLLKEAGWQVVEKKGLIVPSRACVGIKVDDMPDGTGRGYVDYVLYDEDGKPLAVIETWLTATDPERGRRQAQFYADCLERKYNVKPVIYCTDGSTVEVIDRLGYPVRKINGFHSLKDLQMLRQRQARGEIKDMRVDKGIAGRYYQEQAVKAICERLNRKQRRGLLVMATGTGMTRVSIAISDILLRNNWVEHILFLADRILLVSQAHRNYTKLLPSHTTTVLSDNKEPDMNARIMFSTYQTMIHYIDSDKKDFSIGRFDLIIIDEAHRSIFGKYGTIFNYFDSLLIGLTTTPREEIEQSTYELFDEENGKPTSSYEYDMAVKDKYLCPYEVFENTWAHYVYSVGAIDRMLQFLMDEGLRVEDGDKIGKTIIFAADHHYAKLIVRRFRKLYPELGADYCRLIGYSVRFTENVIMDFETRERLPQIAVSVDMLDTGVDVPDILNLVFFKQVRSKISFDQMIGRGTRLSEGIFGPGKDKEKFLVFDWGGNFEYFHKKAKGYVAKPQKSLEELLFCSKVDLVYELQSVLSQKDEFAKQMYDNLKGELYGKMVALSLKLMVVRKQISSVLYFKKKDTWMRLSAKDVSNLKKKIAPILPQSLNSHAAKLFDFLMLQLELSVVNNQYNANKAQRKVMEMVNALVQKVSVPQVKEKWEAIKEVTLPVFWEKLSLRKLERVRLELRDLMSVLLSGQDSSFMVDIEDVTRDGVDVAPMPSLMVYKNRVSDYLMKNKDNNEVFHKIRYLQQLSKYDIRKLEKLLWLELGSKEDYEELVGHRIYGSNVAAFIRSVIGIDIQEGMEKLGALLKIENLNPEQEDVLRQLISYVCENGDISYEVFREEPFNGFPLVSIFGDKAVKMRELVDSLHEVIRA